MKKNSHKITKTRILLASNRYQMSAIPAGLIIYFCSTSYVKVTKKNVFFVQKSTKKVKTLLPMWKHKKWTLKTAKIRQKSVILRKSTSKVVKIYIFVNKKVKNLVPVDTVPAMYNHSWFHDYKHVHCLSMDFAG